MSGRRDQVHFEADLLLSHSPEEIRRAEKALLDAVAGAGYAESSAFAIRLALEEALYNAFRHGHRELPNEKVRLAWRVDPAQVTIRIEDKGPGFKPEALPDPTTFERLELPHGRGVMLIRAYMAEVRYSPRGNEVTMVYRKPDAA